MNEMRYCAMAEGGFALIKYILNINLSCIKLSSLSYLDFLLINSIQYIQSYHPRLRLLSILIICNTSPPYYPQINKKHPNSSLILRI